MAEFFLVGAGPGRADLLTLRAAELLRSADVVLHDRLVSDEVLSLARPGAELIYVGKGEGEQDRTQDRIFDLFAGLAATSRRVVRLKGGDPMVFGRGAEEWAWLAERGLPVEIVPGVSSAIGAPELAGIPASFRSAGCGFAVVTGACAGGAPNVWSRYAAVETLIILMGVARRAEIARALIAAGRPQDEPVCFIENGSTERERVLVADLASVAAGAVEVAAPAVWVTGEVVRLREKLLPHSTAGAAEPASAPR